MTNVDPKIDPIAADVAIKVEDLRIRYGGVTAVENVSFTARPRPAAHAARAVRMRQDHHAAGRRRPGAADLGRITVLGKPMFDSARGIDVPAEQRGMSMVFQSYAIWPHMTVFDSVATGCACARRAARL